jgi:hypothetical protein
MSLAFARKTSEREREAEEGVLTHSHLRVLVHIWGSDMRESEERVAACAYLRAFPLSLYAGERRLS